MWSLVGALLSDWTEVSLKVRPTFYLFFVFLATGQAPTFQNTHWIYFLLTWKEYGRLSYGERSFKCGFDSLSALEEDQRETEIFEMPNVSRAR